ncbi:MAG: hypothetical protein FJW38_21625 [Acidobacteria bacterium]|nr:hypothetical protein [Acidobacteriota bacterium]
MTRCSPFSARKSKPASNRTQSKLWRKDHELNSLPSSAFTNTGYDRGHLATANIPDSANTFLASYAITRDPALNRGQRRMLENESRERHAGQVVTGVVYSNYANQRIE